MSDLEDTPGQPGKGSSHSFAGDPRQVWSLPRAVDALAEAARGAGRPGGIWLAGLGYPTIGFGIAAGVIGSLLTIGTTPAVLDAGLVGIVAQAIAVAPTIAGGTVLFPALYFVFRLQVGLARIAPASIWNRLSEAFGRPRLRQAMRAGKGLTSGAFGMWLMLTGMTSGVIAILITPVLFLIEALARNISEGLAIGAWVLLLLPGLAILMLYGIVLAVVHQLALQSLAHNRRGVSSALVHAWRLAKNDPWSTARTVAVDLVLDLSVWVLTFALAMFSRFVPAGHVLVWIATLMLLGFSGVTRAGYWARAYRALGGLSPDDQVPGLNSETAADLGAGQDPDTSGERARA